MSSLQRHHRPRLANALGEALPAQDRIDLRLHRGQLQTKKPCRGAAGEQAECAARAPFGEHGRKWRQVERFEPFGGHRRRGVEVVPAILHPGVEGAEEEGDLNRLPRRHGACGERGDLEAEVPGAPVGQDEQVGHRVSLYQRHPQTLSFAADLIPIDRSIVKPLNHPGSTRATESVGRAGSGRNERKSMSSSRVVTRWISRAVPLVALISMFAVSPRLNAQTVLQGDALAADSFADPRLNISRDSDRMEEARVSAEVEQGWNAFRAAAAAEKPGEWIGWIDRRTGRLDYAEGPGLAWIPGFGNRLSVQDLRSRYGTKAKTDLSTLEKIARTFMAPLSDALGVDPKELVLSSGRSGRQSDYLWYVDFDVVHAGLPVDGARVFFRINNGNLIQFGTEGIAAPGTETKSATLDRARAAAIAAAAFPKASGVDRITETRLDLVALGLDLPGRVGQFEPGRGVQWHPVWEVSVERKGAPWRVRIDAASGRILAIEDLRDFATAQVRGGVRADATAGESLLPLPFADISIPPGAVNSAGLYNYTNGSVTSALNGTFVKINDAFCGAISQ